MLRSLLIYLSHAEWARRIVTGWSFAWRAASRFVAGEKLEDAIQVVREMNAKGINVTLDHLGENTSDAARAAQATDDIIAALAAIEAEGVRSNVSIKLTQIGLALDEELCAGNLQRLLEYAQERGTFVRIDMEDSPYVQQTLDVFYELFERYHNLGVVIQSYLYRSDDDIERLIKAGASVRMVKGAYLEPATIAHQAKKDVDSAFIRQTERLMSREARANGVYTAIATHDEAIIEWTKRHATEQGIPRDTFEFQMLYGIRRDLQAALVAQGYRMRVYVPYGRQWYPYYMRRIAEQPQNIIWVTQGVLRESMPRR